MKYLSLLLVLTLLLTGCAPAVQGPFAEYDYPADTSHMIAEPAYPEMAPYPNEREYISSVTGEFDNDGFSQVYDAWWVDQNRQRQYLQNYDGALTPFFENSIPTFLNQKAENPVCSPLNLYMALALLAETAAGTSRDQILTTLNIPDIESLRTQAQEVWNGHYCNDNATTSVLANSLWLDEALSYNEETVSTLANHYYASVFRGQLGSEATNQALRTWINQQTGDLLTDQVQNLALESQTLLALVSTILYRAKWNNEFLPQFNTSGIFHTPAEDVPATFMNKTLSYSPYYWGEDFGAASLSLDDGSRMWLILPDEGKTPADLLSSGHALSMILNDPYSYENQKAIQVNLSLPKFDIAADLRMEAALQSLGITDVFSPAQADLTSILPDGGAWLDKVQHAARVTVDEEGVSAAAYTAMMMAGAAMPPEDEIDFILDRPFLFVITSRHNLPLFTGIVNTP